MMTALIISATTVTTEQLCGVGAAVERVLLASPDRLESSDRQIEHHALTLSRVIDQGRLSDLIRQRGPLEECHVFLKSALEGSEANAAEVEAERVQLAIAGPALALRACLAGMKAQGRGRVCLHAPEGAADLDAAIAAFWHAWVVQQRCHLAECGFDGIAVSYFD